MRKPLGRAPLTVNVRCPSTTQLFAERAAAAASAIQRRRSRAGLCVRGDCGEEERKKALVFTETVSQTGGFGYNRSLAGVGLLE
ncbi:MAG TPA: hypothetical protein VKB88_16965 [Bryobacteraceae bacterium]|nr:hypothetical protein [Bryobacteraceae bacterium]